MSLALLRYLPRPPAWQPLGQFPTPLEEAPTLGERLGLDRLLIKREDLSGPRFGGNKLRALEWLLPGAAPVLLTMGGYGSTWCASLALFAGEHRVHVALFPQPWSPTVAGILAATATHATVQLAPRRSALPWCLVRGWIEARRQGPVTWLAPGGADPPGVLGSLNAGLELAEQLGSSDTLDAVVVPCGSGGTAAGLLLAMWLLGWPVDVVAVRVTDPWFATRRRVFRLAQRTRVLCARAGLRIPIGSAGLRLVGQQLGGGYGHPTEDGRKAAQAFAEAGLTLEPTYGAKAAAALPQLATVYRRLCFWHSFDNRLSTLTAIDSPVVHRARAAAESLWSTPILT